MYPDHIAWLIRSPKYSGRLEQPTATGTEARFHCGCFIRFELRITDDPARVEGVRYVTNGCGFMTAAAERLAQLVDGKRLVDLGARFEVEIDYPTDRAVCVSAAANALKAGFEDHRLQKAEEFRGEKALICTCFGVSEEAVEEFIRIERPSEVGEITRRLRAGGGCGACIFLIRDILESADA